MLLPEERIKILKLFIYTSGIIFLILFIFSFETNNVVKIIENIPQKRIRHFANKAINNDTYMLKYIDKIISIEYQNQNERIGWYPWTLEDIASLIQSFFLLLKDNQDYTDFSAYQKNCVDHINKMKNIIRNSEYKTEKFKASECIIAYLSIIETNLLTNPFDQNHWKEEVVSYLSHILMAYDTTFNAEYITSNTLSPEEWMNKIKKKNIISEEECNSLLYDLSLLKKHYGNYQFDKYGRIYFIK